MFGGGRSVLQGNVSSVKWNIRRDANSFAWDMGHGKANEEVGEREKQWKEGERKGRKETTD
jgi:hypothetical protein